ncbi:MAG TPA: TlpA disulfide reductase family protein [Blastocatellia bacterium]|nr:TlpA disulfide reductase family protein [Blastocatellia bacterium]
MSRTAVNSGKRRSRAPLAAGVVLVMAVMVAGCAIMSGSNGSNTVTISPTPVSTDSVQQSLEAYRGKVVILNFWATWCGPCRVEIPDFVALQNKYRDRGLEIVGVSIDPIAPKGNPGGAPAVAPFMKNNGINYTSLMVNSVSALRGYDVSQGIPTTYVLDRSGKIVKTYVGARTRSVFERDINALL